MEKTWGVLQHQICGRDRIKFGGSFTANRTKFGGTSGKKNWGVSQHEFLWETQNQSFRGTSGGETLGSFIA